MKEESTKEFYEPPNAELHDVVLAKWKDGMVMEVKELLVGDFRSLQDAAKQKGGRGKREVLWSRSHSVVIGYLNESSPPGYIIMP